MQAASLAESQCDEKIQNPSNHANLPPDPGLIRHEPESVAINGYAAGRLGCTSPIDHYAHIMYYISHALGTVRSCSVSPLRSQKGVT